MAYIGQREDEWEAEQKKKAKRKAQKSRETCPVCEQKFKSLQGLKMHLRDMHQMKLSPPKPKLRAIEPI